MGGTISTAEAIGGTGGSFCEIGKSQHKHRMIRRTFVIEGTVTGEGTASGYSDDQYTMIRD